ncbi:MAG: hypothetical protein HQ552_02310 [Desulfobacteraceae bacterium]|nr:hypothetical protein [Desulfobacteraceae bacterium]
MSYYWLKKRLENLKKSPTSDKVQTGILIAIFLQAFVLIIQTCSISNHFKIQQRPIVGISEIQPVVLSNNDLQNEIVAGDEFLINVISKNIGESPAFVKYIKVKIFYGYFFKNQEKLHFCTTDLLGESHKYGSFLMDQEVPSVNNVIFKESVLFPNQTTKYTTMVDAKKLLERIRSYTTLREAPIFIEYEANYFSMDKRDQYWYNGLYELQWPKAKHITIYSHLIKSNAEDKPIHLTNALLLEVVAERQRVKTVVNALSQGGKNLNKIVTFDCSNL